MGQEPGMEPEAFVSLNLLPLGLCLKLAPFSQFEFSLSALVKF